MNQQPQSRSQSSDAQIAWQRRVGTLALPIGILLLVLAVAGLVGGEPSTTAYTLFPIGAALLLASTQRYWKRPAATREQAEA
jgi:hypothetical protein